MNNNSVQMLLLGLCLGITLGVLFVPIEINFGCSQYTDEEHEQVQPESHKLPTVSTEIDGNNNLPLMRPPEPKNNNNSRENKLLRPRYFSTELDIRKKLIAGIIMFNSSHNENILQINQTLGQRVDKLMFFAAGSSSPIKLSQLKSLGLAGVVKIGSESNNKTSSFGPLDLNLMALHVIKYFGDKFGQGYDYFFLSLDKFYVNGKLLMDLLEKISVSQDFMWGVPSSRKKSCNLENGFVISRRLIQKLAMKIEQFLVGSSSNGTYKVSKFYRTVFDGLLNCDDTVQNFKYASISLNAPSSEIISAITVGPLNQPSEFEELHSKVSKARLAAINSQIIKLQQQIQQIKPQLPSNLQTLSWPIGIPAGFVPKTRFDVLQWMYFDKDNLFGQDDLSPVKRIAGIDQTDLDHVRNFSSRFILADVSANNNGELLNIEFVNGYRRFDSTRGMEYILDFSDKESEKIFRVQGLRPLCKSELIPMPFVTETQRVTIVVPLTTENVQQAKAFLDRFFNFATDHKLNSVLIFVIVTHSHKSMTKSQTSLELLGDEDVKEVQKLIGFYNGRLSQVIANQVKAGYLLIPMKRDLGSALLTGIDAVINRIMGSKALIVTVDVNVNLKDEFLNRVRMNTILNSQVFSPIPFMEYNPTVYLGKASTTGEAADVEINKNSGYFDRSTFRFFSFYAADYVTLRRTMPSANQTEAEQSQDFSMLPHLFVQYAPLHVLRAPEPSLKIRYSFPSGCSSFEDCAKTLWGTRAQLARLILNSSNFKSN